MLSSGVSPQVQDAAVRVRGRLHVVDHLDPARTALVVIDMQNFFVEPGSPVEVPAARDIVPNVNRLAAATRAAGSTVVWVRMTLDEIELARWSVFLPVNGTPADKDNFCQLEPDKPAHRLWPELECEAGDLYVDKRRFSAFIHGSSNLHDLLAARGIDTLIIVGTLTNVCCESTARDAMMLNYRVLMVDDANATIDARAHQATLDTIFTFFGDVQSTNEVVALFRSR